MQEVSAMILPGGMGYDGATLVPIVTDIGNRLVQTRAQPPVSIVELGKKLLVASKNGETEEVRELMAKGAPFTTDWLGTSPLHFAALHNHIDTCEVLLRAGISRDARTKVDRTPLHMAAYEGHIEVAEMLIVNGADVDSKDMLKMTPLHWAVQNEHFDMISMLLRHGANPDIVNKFDKTPADIAVDLNRMDILQQLQFLTKDPIVINEDLAVNVGLPGIETETHNELETNPSQPTHQDLTGTVIEENSTNIKFENISKFDNTAQYIESTPNVQETLDMNESINILREHGISFLPNDESSVVASAVENGHSLVLTDVGKQVLNSTKPFVKIPVQKTPMTTKLKGRKVVTVTTQQLLAMVGGKNGMFKKLPSGVVNLSEKVKKPVVMDKSKIIISSLNNKMQKKADANIDLEIIKEQLVEARKQAEEYKQMLKCKEAEAERYKRQLQSITQGK